MKNIASILTLITVALCAIALSVPPEVHAQSSALPLGTVTVHDPGFPCSTALNGTLFLPGMNCFHAAISCPNTDSIGIVFGYSVPSGTIQGTIVTFSSGSGTSPSEYADDNLAYLSAYQAKFVVVQLEYSSPWEYPYSTSGQPGNILNAACRPATFLNWVNNNVGLHPSGKAMCAQGASAGSAAIGYSMAWYGASSYLKNVELLSGPTLSEIDQGCLFPKPMTNLNICVPGQYGCTPKTVEWNDNQEYVSFYVGRVNQWTGLNSCAVSGAQNNMTAWAAMSLVDGTSAGVTPTFSYSTTTMHGWLCASSDPCDADHCPNNSAAQGNYFYEALDSSNQTLQLTGVTACYQEEGVGMGRDPDGNHGQGQLASLSITSDMQTNCQ
ncbi:MAG: hypothetical protein WB562_09975 [Candidatus Sulfotelmatobacter sp.]